jgi:hypothetical protein
MDISYSLTKSLLESLANRNVDIAGWGELNLLTPWWPPLPLPLQRTYDWKVFNKCSPMTVDRCF